MSIHQARAQIGKARSPKLGLVAAALALSLLACGESVQTAKPAGKRVDAPAYAGADNQFAEPGWNKGDKASWEAHLRTRAQRGQNDYSRIN